MPHNINMFPNSEANDAAICENDTEPGIFLQNGTGTKKKKKRSFVPVKSWHLGKYWKEKWHRYSYNLSIKVWVYIILAVWFHSQRDGDNSHSGIYREKLLLGQRLHLHTILEPNWARSEAPLNDAPQYSICQELKWSTSPATSFI